MRQNILMIFARMLNNIRITDSLKENMPGNFVAMNTSLPWDNSPNRCSAASRLYIAAVLMPTIWQNAFISQDLKACQSSLLRFLFEWAVSDHSLAEVGVGLAFGATVDYGAVFGSGIGIGSGVGSGFGVGLKYWK